MQLSNPVRLGLGILGVGVLTIITKRNINKIRIRKIREYLDSSTARYGDIRDYTPYFSKSYKDEIIAKYPSFNIALLTHTAVSNYANVLKSAFQVFGSKTDAVFVFSNIRNGVNLSQVSAHYNAISGRSLLSDVNSMNDKYRDQIEDIIKSYKPYQIV